MTQAKRALNWAELNAKAQRELAFNLGYDACLREYMNPKLLVAFDFTNSTYQEARKQAFERVEKEPE